MLDRYMLPLVKKSLQGAAHGLDKRGVRADQVTISGFVLGILALPMLALEAYGLALILILANRIADGLDGTLARIQGTSDAGAFIDISLDFVFYSAVILGFAFAREGNQLAAAVLIFSFVGTGSSFLAFSIMAEKRQIKSTTYPMKGMYYLEGLAEGTETIIIFVLMCLLPDNFVTLAFGFALICLLTTGSRIWSGYHSLKNSP